MEGAKLGAYRVERELGAGGMGRVYLAEVTARVSGLAVGARVALKVIHPYLLQSPGAFKRFLREAEIGKAVAQKNVVRCYDADALGSGGIQHHFLVMEYVEGRTLRDLLDEVGTVPEELCRHIGREVSRGIAAIHEAGVVHRDLKPENVLITPGHEVKVMDLGVARLTDETMRLSKSGAFVGSVLYASPEQFRSGGSDIDGRADLFALGVILYELACGSHPHPEEDFARVLAKVVKEKPRRLGERNPQISPFFEEVVHKLLEKDRKRRFATASDLLRVLEGGEKSAWWADRALTIRAETLRPLRRIRIPRETAVYGRESELESLRDAFEAARAGEGQVIFVGGEAGVGKTRLVDELVERLHRDQQDFNFLFGGNPPGGAATAAGAWSTAYREHFGEEDLEETLHRYLTVTPLLIPAFAALLKGEMPPPGGVVLTADTIQAPFVHATRMLAEERPTVILIEDLHFAPVEGRALFAALAQAVPGHRVLLIGTARPGVPEEWLASLDRLDHVRRIVLDRLGPKDLGELLVDALRSERLAEEIGFRIATKSDGNPFFVFEIIRGLREGRFLRRTSDGTWETTGVIEHIEIPSSVQNLIKARVADLREEDRDLLEVASCCGFEFDGLLPAEVLGLEPIPALQRLGHLEKVHRLVRASGRKFVFDHHQLQECLVSGLSQSLREEYHAAIGGALEQRESRSGRGPDDVEGSLAVDIAEQLLAGARGDRALWYLEPALDHLESGHQSARAIDLGGRALAAPGLLSGGRRAEALLRRGGTLALLGRRKEVEESRREAVELADAGGDVTLKARAHRALGVYHWGVSHHDEAQEELERARALALEAGARKEEAKVVGSLGNVFFSLGQYAEAAEHYEQLVAISREVGDLAGEGQGLGNLGTVCWSQGRYDEALEHCESRLAIARELGDLRGEARASGSLGNIFYSLGRHREAREQYERSLTIARKVGDRRWEGAATGNLGLVLLSRGRYAEAQEHYERWVAICMETGNRRAEASARGNLGSICWSLGRFGAAGEHYEGSLRIARESRDRRGEGIALVDLGALCSDVGDQAGARETLRAALEILREIGVRREEGIALQQLGRAAEREGDDVGAGRLYEEALALRTEIDNTGGIVETLVALGALRAREERPVEAQERLERALELSRDLNQADATVLARCRLALLPGRDSAPARDEFDRLKDRLTLPGAMEARFLLFRLTGDRSHLEESSRLLAHLRDHAPSGCRPTMVENVPLYRDIAAAWEGHGPNGR